MRARRRGERRFVAVKRALYSTERGNEVTADTSEISEGKRGAVDSKVNALRVAETFQSSHPFVCICLEGRIKHKAGLALEDN